MEPKHRNQYTYAILHRNQKGFFKSIEPPEHFQKSIISLLNILGTNEPERYLELYVRNGTVWQPMMGTDSDHPTLFLVPPQHKSPEMQQEEMDLLGTSLFKAYKEIRRLIRAGKRKLKRPHIDREDVKAQIQNLQYKLDILEAAMEETGYANYYKLWLKQNFTQQACARQTNMSLRSWARVTDNLRQMLADTMLHTQPQFVIESITDVLTDHMQSLDIMEDGEDTE